MIKYGTYVSSLGPITVVSDDEQIVMLDFCKCAEESLVDNDSFRDLFKRFDNYFQGKRTEFDDIPIRLNSNSFRMRVYKQVRKIRWGEVATYKEVADAVGTSPRAVGVALSKNPILLLIPCHRVVAETGLGGYSRGVDLKRRLLELEGSLRKVSSIATK
ncbi:Methylated-DNA--protein-cysteine methyltransferase [Metallosphaera sp. J1]|uniref:methylated-DNA--[protein]-cysteine S-methyltransferase n=1 Tax=Metallosphaera javensis (ex Hofmann et al. 2022) TaxID=99938 RepID=UPI001EDDE755|nr:methylated-DNA--[protein]-cysteine S-methyltransferase [Metallosphaera javensis (ex Hofmann et al. 2022)]MCG3108072.1 Methylated-DNA--protein-cysteine methyltransferase [Metallosphaera javensis (ex Hofmann et al. 2022)]